jgi:xylulokinase
MKHILAIDLGTSGPKVACVTTQGEVIAFEFEATPTLLLPNGGAEQRADDWWHGIKIALTRLLDRRQIPLGDLVAISCTTQWAGTVAVDRNLRPLTNAIVWMDTRGAPHVDRLVGGPIALQGYDVWKLFTWLRLSGGVPTHSGKDPIAHILYLKHEVPAVYQAAYKFLEPKDYLNARLTGRCAATHDSIVLHWVTDNRRIDRVDYDPRLLKLAQIDRDKLPDLCRAIDVLGLIKPEVADELGLPHDIPVIGGTPDIFSAAIGSGAVRDYETHLYLGTSSWLDCHVPYKKADVLHNMASFPSALPGRYLLGTEQECAGNCLNYLRDNLIFPDDELANGASPPADVYQRFDRVAEKTAPGSGQVIFLPWLYGERTPIDDPLVRGGFFNLSLHTTREQLVRAVFEGVAYNSRWLLKYVEQFIRRRVTAINAVGGGAKSDVWCQIHADVLNRTIRQVQDPGLTSLRGAAWLAALALGHASIDDIEKHTPIVHTYEPNSDHRNLYDELFAEFVNIYQRNKSIYARLNQPK